MLSSTSQTTGIAPTASMAITSATYAYAGISTSSPGPIDIPARAQISAPVPLEVSIACGVPSTAANSFSKFSDSVASGMYRNSARLAMTLAAACCSSIPI